MSYLFETILPTDRFYAHPGSQEGVYYAYDAFRSKIFEIRASLSPQGLRIERKTHNVPSSKKAELASYLEKEGEAFERDFLSYKQKEAADFSHGLFSYKGEIRRFPDYLANFEEADVFYRYRYYPDPERVAFYTRLRTIYKWLFSIVGTPAPVLFYEHSFPATGLDKMKPLSFSDFGLADR